jgi:hypothetical protein
MPSSERPTRAKAASSISRRPKAQPTHPNAKPKGNLRFDWIEEKGQQSRLAVWTGFRQFPPIFKFS